VSPFASLALTGSLFCRRSASRILPICYELFIALALLFRAPVLCFQQLARSFAKTPGVGYPQRPCGIPRQSHAVSWASASPFRMNTCKSVSKQRTLSSFRMNTYEKPGGRGTPYWI
jgi:hypothetical protein